MENKFKVGDVVYLNPRTFSGLNHIDERVANYIGTSQTIYDVYDKTASSAHCIAYRLGQPGEEVHRYLWAENLLELYVPDIDEESVLELFKETGNQK